MMNTRPGEILLLLLLYSLFFVFFFVTLDAAPKNNLQPTLE